MKKYLLILALAFLAGLVGLASSVYITGPGALLRSNIGQWLFQEILTPVQDTDYSSIKIGQRVPAFTVTDFSGQPYSLPKPGHWQVLNYWASWCAPCRKEMPLLNNLSTQSAGSYEVIGIALDNSADAKAFLAETPIAFVSFQELPSQQDSSSRMGNGWGVLPFTVLISPDGRLMRRHIGKFESAQQLQEWLSAGFTSNQ
jgi:thiol-disulfide isomerase/thioredoxin